MTTAASLAPTPTWEKRLLLGWKVMLAQAQNADTRLTRRDIDMLLDRLQTANPESAQVAGTTDDEFRQKFAALARKKVGERPPEE